MWNIWLTIATLSVASLRLKYLIYKNKSNIWSFFWPWCKMSGWQQQPHQLPHRGSADWGRPEPRHNNTQSRLFLTQNCCLRNAKHKKITNTERYIPQTQNTYTFLDRSSIGMAPSPCFFLINRTANFWYFLLNYKESLVSIQFNDGTEAHTDMHCKSKIREAVKNKCFF